MADDDIELGMRKLTSNSTSSLSSPYTTISESKLPPPPPPPPQYVSVPLPVKLSNGANYLLWKSFFIPILKYHDMLDLAEGREPCPPQFLDDNNEVVENPVYTDWIKRDQLLLAWINASLTESLLHRFAGGCTSGRALWLSLENLLALKAQALVKVLKTKLENLEIYTIEGQVYECYLKKFGDEAKEIAEKLDAAGSPVKDDEFVSCVLQGLVRCKCDELKDLAANFITKDQRPVPLTREECLFKLEIYPLSEKYPPYVPSVSSVSSHHWHHTRGCETICSFLFMIILVGVECFFIYLLIHDMINKKK